MACQWCGNSPLMHSKIKIQRENKNEKAKEKVRKTGKKKNTLKKFLNL